MPVKKPRKEPPRYIRVVDGRGKTLPPKEPPTGPDQQIGVLVVDRFKNRVLWGEVWDVAKVVEIMNKALARGDGEVQIAQGFLTIGHNARDAVYDAVTKAMRRRRPRSKRT